MRAGPAFTAAGRPARTFTVPIFATAAIGPLVSDHQEFQGWDRCPQMRCNRMADPSRARPCQRRRVRATAGSSATTIRSTTFVLGVELMFNQTPQQRCSGQAQYATQSQLNAEQRNLRRFLNSPASSSHPEINPNIIYEYDRRVRRGCSITERFRIRGGWAFGSFPSVRHGRRASDSRGSNYPDRYRDELSRDQSGCSFTNTAVHSGTSPTFSTNPGNRERRLLRVRYKSTSGRYFFGFFVGVGIDYALTRSVSPALTRGRDICNSGQW